jgi:drug/metabolite transporter (DMT)-like permease
MIGAGTNGDDGIGLTSFDYLFNVLFLKALNHLDAIQTGICNYLITFFGVPIAVIWLGERLAPMAIIGGIIILCGTLLVALGEAGGVSPVKSDSEAFERKNDQSCVDSAV